MEVKKLILCFLILIFISGCNIAREKSYYSQFKNPNLNYSWDFNSSLLKGGYTFNSTYFQLTRYNFFQEVFQLEIPYEIQYKHEEGHIYHNQLLNINDFDQFGANKFELLNRSDYDSYRCYIISVSEGIADYYMVNYFNNSLSKDYYRRVESNKEKNIKYLQHYQGLKYIIHSLKTKIYSNFTNLILDLGSEKQYFSYSTYLNETMKLKFKNLSSGYCLF